MTPDQLAAFQAHLDQLAERAKTDVRETRLPTLSQELRLLSARLSALLKVTADNQPIVIEGGRPTLFLGPSSYQAFSDALASLAAIADPVQTGHQASRSA
ncbi:hypothetical protein [Luteimonas sp. MHLX1A]|uniref:hypothetical protein n=1 Tax=Alterluteimonas muca TaxID=2878684 RepID=UPI001E4AEFE3|nr:hypothetical protein [Luteimonas sp. MHLX1A]MCD9046781.1 hypothetical protein [Luteimonas sp. MHLX1A]